jgi:endonuclease/exonuclease/phosphatase family metal-dependent hydrolase
MDFFYDGGIQVRPTKTLYQKYYEGITDFILQNQEIDFILLQEVDQKSKRSYYNNQVAHICDAMKNHGSAFAKNYDVGFVPVPVLNPMGRVTSGLLTLSKYNPVVSERIAFDENFAWPKRLFMLDRCFLVQRFRLDTASELVVINTHNSAFDNGQLRKAQLKMLCSFATEEYAKGNYVLVGGDWNQNPPNYQSETISSGDYAVSNELGNISPHVMPADWIWAFDPKTPSNRSVQKNYTKTKSPTSIIDFFLLSPNIRITNIETQDIKFAFSDHNPVLLSIELR